MPKVDSCSCIYTRVTKKTQTLHRRKKGQRRGNGRAENAHWVASTAASTATAASTTTSTATAASTAAAATTATATAAETACTAALGTARRLHARHARLQQACRNTQRDSAHGRTTVPGTHTRAAVQQRNAHAGVRTGQSTRRARFISFGEDAALS